MARITITLTERVRDALIAYGSKELRDPRVQAAIIIVDKLRELGFLGGEGPRQQENQRSHKQIGE